MIYTFEQFLSELHTKIKMGKVFNNLRKRRNSKNTSEIISIDDNSIVYKRESDKNPKKIPIKIKIIYDVYKRLYEGYWGDKCSSNDLRKYKPEVFVSIGSGHGCNCTFVFLVLKELGFVMIEGEGVSKNPFYIIMKK